MAIQTMMFDGPGQPLRAVEFPRPVLQAGEALVKVQICTLCGSDLHTFAGRRTEPTPCILGHEIVGILDEVNGELQTVNGEALKVGDRVTWSVAVSCKQCYYCLRDWPQKCEKLIKYGHVKHGLHGGLATHCHLLANTSIVKVPDSLSSELAAPAMCATATACAGLRTAEAALRYSDPVALVVGAGLLGCTLTALLATRGVRVIATDVDENRLLLAKKFGAAEAVPSTQLRELLPRGADACFDLSGHINGVRTCTEYTRTGGTMVWIGTVSPTPALEIVPERVVRQCWTLRGIHNYAPVDLSDAIRFLCEYGSRFPLANLGPRFSLPDVEHAFHYAEQHKPTRVLIEC